MIIEYRKVYQGLTPPGILAHITSSILLWNRGNGKGNQNDCQLTINHLLRAYHRRHIKDHPEMVWATSAGRAAKQRGSGYHLEHAIPVACVMWALFNEVTQRDFDKAYDQVRKVIHETMHFAYVTHSEHAKLNKAYGSSMPEGHKAYPWPNPWIRYEKSKVPVPVGPA